MPRFTLLSVLISVGFILFSGCGPETQPDVAAPAEGETASSTPANASQSTTEETSAPKAGPQISDQEFRDAAYAGDVHIVKDALTQGVSIDTTDAEGRTALMMAAFDGRERVVELLLEHNPQLDRRDQFDRTALIYASSGKNPGVVNKLLKAGANVHAVDNQERFSALMFAAAEGNVEVVRLLLKYGANPALPDIDGETALQFAAQGGHQQVVALLQEKLGEKLPASRPSSGDSQP